MSRDFCKKVWDLIYEEVEGQAPGGKRVSGGDKVATELTLADVGALYGAATDLIEGHPFGHALRVAYLAQELAFGLELDVEVITDITLAALFHDVGLFRITHGLSDVVAGNESEVLVAHAIEAAEDLAPQIRKGSIQQVSELLINHAAEGAAILSELPVPAGVARLVGSHHERYDGRGFPEGLRGDGVPTELCVLTAGDCMETAIERAGERGHSPEFVRGEAMTLSNSYLNPNVAKQLVEVAQNVRFWGTFTGGQLEKQIASRLPQERLELTYSQIALFLRRLVELVDGKSPYRAGHSWVVARNAFLMATELGIENGIAATIGIAGLLHDLGKAGISNQILDKPKWLTGPEYEQAKKHIYYTQKIVGYAQGLFAETQEWIDQHHERLDGSGYPNRLKGDQLGREVRILATADVYDALISDRPYRKGLDPLAAVRFMEGKVNRYFDPEVLAALGAVVEASKSA